MTGLWRYPGNVIMIPEDLTGVYLLILIETKAFYGGAIVPENCENYSFGDCNL